MYQGHNMPITSTAYSLLHLGKSSVLISTVSAGSHQFVHNAESGYGQDGESCSRLKSVGQFRRLVKWWHSEDEDWNQNKIVSNTFSLNTFPYCHLH